jgi:hypothetical protein
MRKAILFTLFFSNIVILSAQCIDGNCNNGSGIAIFKKKGGVKYSGYFKSKRPHGKGTAEYPNGRVYTGDWSNGMWHGQGVLTLTDGTSLSGDWEFSKFKSIINHTQPAFASNNSDRSKSEFSNIEPDNSSVNPNQRRIVNPAPIIKTDESTVATTGLIPEIWAVAVGVAQYENQTIPTLKYPDNDAYSIYSFWKSPQGGALDDEHSEILVDDAATKGMVTTTLRNTFSKAKENDLAIFFFSGHGLKGSFLTTDYDGDGIKLYHSEINKILSDCPAKTKLVIADACHSGSYIASKGTNPIKINSVDIYKELTKSQPGIAYFLSSQAEEESLEVSTLHNSVFTYFVLRGMKGEANANNDNVVTIKELFDYVYLNVTDYAAKLGKVQTPMLKGNYDPNLPVAIVRK